MITALLLAIFSILFLVVLHELGHFFSARKFGVKAEEFGVGMPFTPAIFKKKIGETVYSFYPLLIGAFVRLLGEEKASEDPRSFNRQPVLKRIIIVGAGVVSSWVVAAAILAFLGVTWGIPMAIDDDTNLPSGTTHVQITGIAPNSPAQNAGLQLGDIIQRIENKTKNQAVEPKTIKEITEFVNASKESEIMITVDKGRETKNIALVPRSQPPVGEGAIGVQLSRVGYAKFAWYEAPYQGVVLTGKITVAIVSQTGQMIAQKIRGDGPPLKDQIAGPVGMVSMLQNSLFVGPANFLYFVAQIAIYLAIFNTLPIPALDGGRIVFLAIEGIIRKPLPEKIIQTMIIVSFLLLVPLIIWATFNDIQRIF
ncbi:MAG: site-2 protease family protein [Candidatus Wildermuthbacteria bacterium]|nr:site-2 protease family protein [Candidatus Wildermuthbacteria bacterium]